MRPEAVASTLANMSAPPRSTVMLPRLATGVPAEGNAAGGSARSSYPARDVPVGPGGGRLLSHALCLARVELPAAVCAHLHMGFSVPLFRDPLGLARALVAIARHADDSHKADAARGRSRAARSELRRVGRLPEGELVRELTSWLETIDWPHWVPRVALVTTLGNDIGTSLVRVPEPPRGIVCPLLAARVVSAMRGPVFMRDAAPTLTHLLDLFGGTTPSGTWELWLPVRPGTIRRPPVVPPATSREPP